MCTHNATTDRALRSTYFAYHTELKPINYMRHRCYNYNDINTCSRPGHNAAAV